MIGQAFVLTLLVLCGTQPVAAQSVKIERSLLSKQVHSRLAKIHAEPVEEAKPQVYNKYTGLPMEHNAHPRDADYNTEKPIVKSLPLTIECTICFLWILLVTMVPVMLMKVTNRGLSRAYCIMCGIMYVSLWLGVYLFTHIIVFDGYHWEGRRSLTMVECCYFMSTIISTVGYGDITPAYPRGQVFVGVYIVFSVLIIAILVSDVVDYLLEVTKSSIAGRRNVHILEEEHHMDLRTAWLRRQPKVGKASLVQSLLIYAFFMVTFMLFFHWHPEEDLQSWEECVYFSLITMSTVGFGALYPHSEIGKAFLAFWMIFGSVALVKVISDFTTYCALSHELELYDADTNRQALEKANPDGKKDFKMSETEYIRFYLINHGLVEEAHIDNFLDAFHAIAERSRKTTASRPAASAICLDMFSQQVGKANLGSDALDPMPENSSCGEP